MIKDTLGGRQISEIPLNAGNLQIKKRLKLFS